MLLLSWVVWCCFFNCTTFFSNVSLDVQLLALHMSASFSAASQRVSLCEDESLLRVVGSALPEQGLVVSHRCPRVVSQARLTGFGEPVDAWGQTSISVILCVLEERLGNVWGGNVKDL